STQEYLGAWNNVDMKGNSFDSLDRTTAKYAYVTVGGSRGGHGPSETLEPEQSITYDGATQYGLTSSDCNSASPSECKTLAYDAVGRITAISFSGTVTPNRTVGYDADSRATSISSVGIGAQTYQFDADGRLVTSTEPSSLPSTAPAILTYGYYGNGQRTSVSVAPV